MRERSYNQQTSQTLTGSFPRNSNGSDKMTLSIAIFIAQRGRDKREDLFRINKRKNTRTLRSFFSFGVSFGLPFFLTFATADLDDSGARDVSANVGVSINAVAFVASSSFAAASACACSAAEMAARASSSAQSIFSQSSPKNNQ